MRWCDTQRCGWLDRSCSHLLLYPCAVQELLIRIRLLRLRSMLRKSGGLLHGHSTSKHSEAHNLGRERFERTPVRRMANANEFRSYAVNTLVQAKVQSVFRFDLSFKAGGVVLDVVPCHDDVPHLD